MARRWLGWPGIASALAPPVSPALAPAGAPWRLRQPLASSRRRSSSRASCSIQTGVDAATKRAMLRTDTKERTAVAATTTASRARSRRLTATKPARLTSITAKVRTSSMWKFGGCHS